MKHYCLTFLLGMACCILTTASAQMQTIKGTIVDKQTQYPLSGVSVAIVGLAPIRSTVTNANGSYALTVVAPGRYSLKISMTGYKEFTINDLSVITGKEALIDVGLEENINTLSGVIISRIKKNETNNERATVSGRSFSMEEVNRYAGGRSDPSRLVANFAGVSSPNDSRNDIVIRGNSPIGMLWRIDGLNIPNPNHFSTIGTTGGPVSGINTNLLKNSDFFTAAFPAEYGNANAGVFDIEFRNGNPDKREHTLQFGAVTGLEAMTEGPINTAKGSSYVVAYRYSFTGLAQSLGLSIGTAATPFYQDVSFKLNSGYTKIGRFALFGLGGRSKIDFIHNKIDSTDIFADPTKDSYFTSDIGMVGLNHLIRISGRSYVNTIVGGTYAAATYKLDTVSTNSATAGRIVENSTSQIRYALHTSFNSKISSRLFIKIGFMDELISLKLFNRSRQYTAEWRQIWDFNDFTSLLQGYAHVKYQINEKLKLNAGAHTQYLTLNNSFALEPRAAIQYQLNLNHSFSAGYGWHSQMQPMDVYFYRSVTTNGSYDQSNQNLDFTRSQHFVIGHEVLPFKGWRVKTELYYQELSNVPVTQQASSFSMLNAGASFEPTNQGNLENSGTGENYGLELTLEKFFSHGYYGMFTGSLYHSTYKGSDKVTRNTAFNGNYVYNLLFGKEFKLGKEKRNTFTLDFKMTQAGGRYYTPVNLEASQIAKKEVLEGDFNAFVERYPDFFRLDLKMGIVVNSKVNKLSHSWFFDVQNITNNKNVFAHRFNPVTNTINTAYQIGFFPNFVYKVQF